VAGLAVADVFTVWLVGHHPGSASNEPGGHTGGRPVAVSGNGSSP